MFLKEFSTDYEQPIHMDHTFMSTFGGLTGTRDFDGLIQALQCFNFLPVWVRIQVITSTII